MLFMIFVHIQAITIFMIQLTLKTVQKAQVCAHKYENFHFLLSVFTIKSQATSSQTDER